MSLILVKPDYFVRSAADGLSLFASTVLPAIFPFFFCSLLLSKCGGVFAISEVFGKPVKKLFNAPEISAFPLFISLLSGYPSGASTLKNLYDDGYADKETIESMLSFTSTSGPLFILGTVGAAIYDDYLIGVVILISHYIATFLNGIIWRKKSNYNQNNKQFLTINVDNAVSESISSSTLAMLSVGGYIVVCNMIIDAVALIPIDFPPVLSAIIYGGIEMTRGTIFAKEITYLPLSVATASAICTLGGLSVTLQSYGFLSACGIKLKDYLQRKITQTIFAFMISLIFSLFF